jgi:histidyl-tRNA synthetase
MALSNVEIADNIINLLNKVKENEAFNDTIDKKEQTKLFNKIVKAGIKGQTKINIKTFKKEPNEYNTFIKDMMPTVKQENPTLSSSEIFK